MIDPAEIESTLEKALPGATIRVDDLTGGGDHFQVWIVSSLFEGKSLLDQHQMVYEALRGSLGDDKIHALSLKTYTPEQWERVNS